MKRQIYGRALTAIRVLPWVFIGIIAAIAFLL
jgi:hypothetical protein